jgi:cytochrome P450
VFDDQTTVGIYQTVAYHMTKNFRDPESFEPGRWLGDAQFADDRKGIFKPFSTGPKNCIGKE